MTINWLSFELFTSSTRPPGRTARMVDVSPARTSVITKKNTGNIIECAGARWSPHWYDCGHTVFSTTTTIVFYFIFLYLRQGRSPGAKTCSFIDSQSNGSVNIFLVRSCTSAIFRTFATKRNDPKYPSPFSKS